MTPPATKLSSRAHQWELKTRNTRRRQLIWDLSTGNRKGHPREEMMAPFSRTAQLSTITRTGNLDTNPCYR
ncbi:uncharacterized protein N7529_009984 [Penicillium soppii]|uniref:uncharacterized protein n=1 Tax=Penicillium soppii TaxID=69789 RepID=UPI002546E8AE|nr:uncharacterized protein N7529_009984 [Penicillium soppii]KAJ5856040.1 hypothetical protein N7529_009984 [Penicillium soppii]